MGGVLTSLTATLKHYTPQWFIAKPEHLKKKSINDHNRHHTVRMIDNDSNDDNQTSSLRSSPSLSLRGLPNDVIMEILSRLDLVTLCHCMAASPRLISPLLSRIRSLSTPLPSSMISLSDESWHAPRITHLSQQIQRLIAYMLLQTELGHNYHDLLPMLEALLIADLCHIMENSWTPRFSISSQRFLQRLTDLETMEVEFSIPHHLMSPDLWFRWFAMEDDSESVRRSYVSVHATLVEPDEQSSGQDQMMDEPMILWQKFMAARPLLFQDANNIDQSIAPYESILNVFGSTWNEEERELQQVIEKIFQLMPEDMIDLVFP